MREKLNWEISRSKVCLHYTQWERLVDKFSEINKNISENARENPCYLDDDHQNQLGALMCKNCSPYTCNGYFM